MSHLNTVLFSERNRTIETIQGEKKISIHFKPNNLNLWFIFRDSYHEFAFLSSEFWAIGVILRIMMDNWYFDQWLCSKLWMEVEQLTSIQTLNGNNKFAGFVLIFREVFVALTSSYRLFIIDNFSKSIYLKDSLKHVNNWSVNSERAEYQFPKNFLLFCFRIRFVLLGKFTFSASFCAEFNRTDSKYDTCDSDKWDNKKVMNSNDPDISEKWKFMLNVFSFAASIATCSCQIEKCNSRT